ncbi:hypothetical protein [Modestobacter sp. SYSU DS0875]
MSRTDALKHYGETLVDTGRTGLLAALGAGDVAVDRARTVVGQFRSRTEALPGEAQVQADLAGKEARTRAEQARARAAQAAAEARVRAAQAREQAAAAAQQARVAAAQARTAAVDAAATVRPDTVMGTVTGLVETARTQALTTIGELADRGATLVGPTFQRFAGRAEQAVDTMEGAVADAAGTAQETVDAASNEVTSVAQKTAARADDALDTVAGETAEAAATTKRRVRDGAATATEETAGKPAKKATARKAPAKKAGAERGTAAESTTPVPDPLAVPAKSDDAE